MDSGKRAAVAKRFLIAVVTFIGADHSHRLASRHAGGVRTAGGDGAARLRATYGTGFRERYDAVGETIAYALAVFAALCALHIFAQVPCDGATNA